jgi:hypothetical protein
MTILFRFILVLPLLILLGTGSLLHAQEATPEPLVLQGGGEGIDPNASISFPPPVYTVRDKLEIRGSANLPDMLTYFIEYRPLNPDLTVAAAETPWLPLMLPSSAAIANDVLVIWDSTTVPDGVYELRLSVNTASGLTVNSVVRPLRVENTPPPFLQLELPAEQPPLIPTLTLPAQPIPTLTLPAQLIPTLTPLPTLIPATPTATLTPTEDTTPRALVTIQANIRAGDDTAFNAIGAVEAGTSLRIVGVSNRNTGWYLVDLPDGRRGWIGSGVIQLSGSTANLPRVQPPPFPATATPLPTPTPATQANLVAGIVVLDPSSPRCGETFTVGFDVANLGSAATSIGGVVALQDSANGAVRASTSGSFPVLQPGQTFRVNMPIVVAQEEDETHTIVLVIDAGNAIAETNENDNRQQINYRLQESDNC